MSTFIVNKSIRLNARPAEVWDALTNPEKTKKYFFHCRVLSDWKPGSPITFKGRIFLIKKIEMQGQILAVDRGRLLKYSLNNESDGKQSSSVVTDTLVEEDGQTLLTISDDVGDGPGAQERYDRSVKGWDNVLNGLK